MTTSLPINQIQILGSKDLPIPKDFTGVALWGSNIIKKEWYVNGVLHREDGPAIEYLHDQKSEFWFKNGKRHRVDGPAAIMTNGYSSWWIDGELYETKEEWFQALTLEQQENALWSVDLWK